jgi:hypothetical protein
MKKFKLLVLTNAVAGREQEFNDWYTSRHLQDILRVKGVVSAQRFRFRAGKDGFGFLAMYDLETDDPDTVLATIRERDKTGVHVISDAISREGFYSGIFEPITERITSTQPV